MWFRGEVEGVGRWKWDFEEQLEYGGYCVQGLRYKGDTAPTFKKTPQTTKPSV